MQLVQSINKKVQLLSNPVWELQTSQVFHSTQINRKEQFLLQMFALLKFISKNLFMADMMSSAWVFQTGKHLKVPICSKLSSKNNYLDNWLQHDCFSKSKNTIIQKKSVFVNKKEKFQRQTQACVVMSYCSIWTKTAACMCALLQALTDYFLLCTHFTVFPNSSLEVYIIEFLHQTFF